MFEEENQSNKIKQTLQNYFSELIKYFKLHIERPHCRPGNTESEQTTVDIS